ncbi:ankyrin repeat ph and sec7 domain containing protein secg-related [Anaeramoeba flamelloides]|uniref:Ankyrin repeat ph and sec7 domain containing protein secg-related n=1 Tax=Anaeramoeba flamelloides TaxID=1746091 RepID=A0AAV7YGY8_9EUKA|nr:ankyrin repeat ph and sec7 domain containing protein secg-related [Anaeramoeba flamelloides]
MYFQYVTYDRESNRSVVKELLPPEKIQGFLQSKYNYNKSRSVFTKYFARRKHSSQLSKIPKIVSFLFNPKFFNWSKNLLFVLYVLPLITALIGFTWSLANYGWYKLITVLSIPFYFNILYFFAYDYLSKNKYMIHFPRGGYKKDIVIVVIVYLFVFLFYTMIVCVNNIHIAAFVGHLNISNQLMSMGADFNVRDRFDYSAIDYACLYAQYEIVKSIAQSQGINFTKTQEIKDFCSDRYLFNLPLYIKDNSLIKSKNDIIIKSNNFFMNIYDFFHYIFKKKFPIELQVNKLFLEKRTNKNFQTLHKQSSKMLQNKLDTFYSLIYSGDNADNFQKKSNYFGWHLKFQDLRNIYGYSQIKNTFNGLYLCDDSKDLAIDINGEEIYVHKFILNSHSKYFHNLIQRRPKMTIYVDQFHYEYFIWKKLISYLYNQKLDENLSLFDLNKIENLAQDIQILSNSSLSLEIDKYKKFSNKHS